MNNIKEFYFRHNGSRLNYQERETTATNLVAVVNCGKEKSDTHSYTPKKILLFSKKKKELKYKYTLTQKDIAELMKKIHYSVLQKTTTPDALKQNILHHILKNQ